MSSERVDFLTNLYLLISIEGLGPTKILNLINKFKSAEAVFDANFSELIKIDGINKNLAERIITAAKRSDEFKQRCLVELDNLERNRSEILTYFDEAYPKILRNIYYPPLVLYINGKLIEKDSISIAMVGTRNPSAYGKSMAELFARELSLQQITIVSGLARGIDSISHRAALSSGGRTIAVIGSGLDVIYPPENKKLFHEIAENGAVISEYPLGTKPDAQNFPRRNRIISGLSLGSLIVETKINGGALLTANYALDQNREVFAIPGNINNNSSSGTNRLIQKGEAKLVTRTEDILEELQLKLKPEVGVNIPKPSLNLNMFEEKIIEALDRGGIQIDVIAEKTGMSTSDCLVNLLTLGFKGAVKQLPGKVFARVF